MKRRWAAAEARTGDPSPFPWVSDRVWQQREQWSRFEGLKSAAEPGEALEADAYAVSAEAAKNAPRAALSLRECPIGSIEDQQRRLDATDDVAAFWNSGYWPVCCGRLAVLELVNPSAEELEAWEAAATVDVAGATLRLEGARYAWEGYLRSVRAGAPPENGLHVFVCSHCGATYGDLSHT